jgi:CheY-like chemotaxis protein
MPQIEGPRVVLVEDRLEDELLVREALAPRFPNADITVLRDGEQMMRWIDMIESEYAPCPDVILLDLNLPRFRGEQVLERLRGTNRCGPIPVVIVTSSDNPMDRAAAANLDASRYFRKPQDYDAFMKLGDVVYDVLSAADAAGAAG